MVMPCWRKELFFRSIGARLAVMVVRVMGWDYSGCSLAHGALSLTLVLFCDLSLKCVTQNLRELCQLHSPEPQEAKLPVPSFLICADS